MDNLSIINCALIFVGAIIMLVSIFSTRKLFKSLPLVPEQNRKSVTSYLSLHRGLMVFFLISYIAVMFAFIFNSKFFNDTLISIIFLFGSVFVLLGIKVQSRLLVEVEQTLEGLLPICCKCKKIRKEDSDPKDPESWEVIEAYITEKVDVEFSHGYCPECFEVEKQSIEENIQKRKQASS